MNINMQRAYFFAMTPGHKINENERTKCKFKAFSLNMA